MTHLILEGDCLHHMKQLDDNSVDLVITSPPYENARSYGIDFNLKGEDWVAWAMERYMECVRVSRGLVAWVVAGRTQSYKWSATPAMLMADLHRAGVNLRNPALYKRIGTPGSGGPDWLRSNYEWIICSSKPGRLPWSDNTAMGHTPKCPPGGAPSHQTRSGRVKRREYKPPTLANPGNIIDCGAVGGGHLGSPLAHENEAPFPELVPEFFIRSFCPPGGTVLDPFAGSGTTAKVAGKFGRESISIDIRESQTDLVERRLEEIEVCS